MKSVEVFFKVSKFRKFNAFATNRVPEEFGLIFFFFCRLKVLRMLSGCYSSADEGTANRLERGTKERPTVPPLP